MAKGLGRIAGAVLQGAGTGILQQAQNRRQDTLLRIRRQWQQEDRAQERAWRLEDRQAAESLTREGWDRADARSASGQPLIPTIDPETGTSVYTPRSDAAGMQVPTSKADRRDPLTEVVGPDGSTILVPESQAAGMSPPSKRAGAEQHVTAYDPDLGRDVIVSRSEAMERGLEPARGAGKRPMLKDMMGNFTGYAPSPSEWDAQQGQAAAQPSPEEEEALMDRAEAAFDNLGPEWYESFDVLNPFVDSDEEVAGASKEEFVQRLTQLIRQNPNVPDDELARHLASEFAGGQQGGGEGEGAGQAQGAAPAGEPQPPAGYPPNARQAPDGKWYVPDPNSPSGWSLFTP